MVINDNDRAQIFENNMNIPTYFTFCWCAFIVRNKLFTQKMHFAFQNVYKKQYRWVIVELTSQGE